MKTTVLFVCLGNICRSPIARALFDLHAGNNNVAHLFSTDSAGTSGHHSGENADPRTLKNAHRNGLILNHRARKFMAEDFHRFDHIIVMDRQNLVDVLSLDREGQFSGKVKLMREWDPEHPGADVPDPWYGGEEGFQHVFDVLHRSTDHLMQEMLDNQK